MKHAPFPFRLLYVSCIIFITLTTIGMLYYPGGTLTNHYARGYDFFNNFFSDLGRTKTLIGESKWISFFCFEFALILHSTAILIFNLNFLRNTNSKQLNKVAYYTAFVCGILFPIFLTGIALTPCDLYLPQHLDFVFAAFGTLVPLSFSYFILIRKHDILPNRYGNVLLFIVIAIVVYIGLMKFGPNPKETPYVQQTAQKAIVYTMIFSLLYLAKGCIDYSTQLLEHKKFQA